MGWIVHAHPGSAPRLRSPEGPPPPSGFAASQSPAAVFHAAAVPRPPFRGFPSRGASTSLEATCSLAVIHPRAETHGSTLVTAGFADAHTFVQLPDFPRPLWVPFRGAETPFPVALASSRRTVPFRELHPLRSFPPRASPFTPARVASNRRSFLSWSFAPLELSPPTPGSLDPPDPEGSNPLFARDSLGNRTRRPETLPRLDLRRATQGTSRPLTPGEHAPGHAWPPDASSSAVSGPLRDRPAPSLDGDSYSPDLAYAEQARRPWPPKSCST